MSSAFGITVNFCIQFGFTVPLKDVASFSKKIVWLQILRNYAQNQFGPVVHCAESFLDFPDFPAVAHSGESSSTLWLMAQ
jgi:hypothetical protein